MGSTSVASVAASGVLLAASGVICDSSLFSLEIAVSTKPLTSDGARTKTSVSLIKQVALVGVRLARQGCWCCACRSSSPVLHESYCRITSKWLSWIFSGGKIGHLALSTWLLYSFSSGQTGHPWNLDFKVKFEYEDQHQSIPQTMGILTKMFYTYAPNLVWTSSKWGKILKLHANWKAKISQPQN